MAIKKIFFCLLLISIFPLNAFAAINVDSKSCTKGSIMNTCVTVKVETAAVKKGITVYKFYNSKSNGLWTAIYTKKDSSYYYYSVLISRANSNNFEMQYFQDQNTLPSSLKLLKTRDVSISGSSSNFIVGAAQFSDIRTPNTSESKPGGVVGTISGKLVKTLYDREAKTQHWGIDTTGGRDPIIKSLPSNTTFTPSRVENVYYKCSLWDSETKPTKVECKKTGDNSGEASKNDPDYGGSSASGSSSSSSGATEKETVKAPLGMSFADVEDKGILQIDSSKCEKGSNVYTKGILNGVSCEGPMKSLKDVLIFVKNIVYVLLLPSAGIIFLIMFGIGGLLYITSNGNQTMIDRAKKTLTAAVIGLLIVVFAYAAIGIFTRLLGGVVK